LSLSPFRNTDNDKTITNILSINPQQYSALSKYFKQVIVSFPCKSFFASHIKLPQIVFNKEVVHFSYDSIYQNAFRILRQKWQKRYSLENIVLLIYKANPMDPLIIYEENINMLKNVISSFDRPTFRNVYFYYFGLQKADHVEKLI
jgi:hypothetical protein